MSKNLSELAGKKGFKENLFDYYTISFGIRNVTDQAAAINEAFRVLKKGGTFLCMEFSRPQNFTCAKLYDIYKTVNTDKNVFYSAYIKQKAQYNDVNINKSNQLIEIGLSEQPPTIITK